MPLSRGSTERVHLHRTTAQPGTDDRQGDTDHLRCVGAFTTVAGTHRWPRRITLWELADGWAGAAHVAPPRSGRGRDRLLIAAPETLVLDEQRAATRDAECYYHEEVALHPGTARRYLQLVHAHRVELAAGFGWRLVGAYRTAMVHDSEAIVLWAVPTWEDWARWETAEAADPSVSIWRGLLDGVVRDWRSTVMVADPQPVASEATDRAQR